ncbi:MAG TPA: ABC transporter ATP-binding protein [Candidatus Limnocylindria bacterium]|jgi:ABC-2 type transport system ATP-binding protein|nr:ABC transporter ATP-binding protein [Candidatus Limnocylindria bacterium]
MAEPALAFDGLTKRYRNGTLALKEVTWSIAVGSRACLLGPNGSGKTTSIRLLEGALAPTTGWVTLLDHEVNGPGYAEVRLRTGIVPQNAGMYPDLTTSEYLDLARRLYGRGDLARVIDAFGLGEHRDKRLAQLSGGFQRRLLLATALLSEPDVLLLDEPTVGLDPVAAHEVHEYLREAMQGRTTLLCTHNLAEAEALCDDVVILRDGTVLLHEPLAGLRARQRSRTRIAALQPPEAVAAAVRRRGLAAAVEDGAVIVEIDARAEGPKLLRALLADGFDVYESRPLAPTLEQLFLEAVGA